MTNYAIGLGVIAALAGVAGSAHAQWSEYSYEIRRAGLTSPAHTGEQGLQRSSVYLLNSPGVITGFSNRYIGVSTANGQNAWVFDRGLGATIPIGLVGPEQTGVNGFQSSTIQRVNDAGFVVGYSLRNMNLGPTPGENCWLFDPSTRETIPIGLTTPAHTSTNGYQLSDDAMLTSVGQVIGTSIRFGSTGTENGQDVWFYDPLSRTTRPIGLLGPPYVGTAGYQFSKRDAINESGQSVGQTHVILSARTHIATAAWYYNPAADTTTRIGLLGSDYTGSAGAQVSETFYITPDGIVGGRSSRVKNVDEYNGADRWLYFPATNTTTRIGLVGGEFTGSEGYQFSINYGLDSSGIAAGSSSIMTGLRTKNGSATWVYSVATGVTVRTGLSGPAYVGSNGYQFSSTRHASHGKIHGRTTRIRGVNTSNGDNTWYYSLATGTTVQTGLVGPEYTGTNGYQHSDYISDDPAGDDVAGTSQRVLGVNTVNGFDAWYYDASANTTIRVGLSEPIHTGSAGFRESTIFSVSVTGLAIGSTARISGVNTKIGRDFWVFDSRHGTVVKTGLTGGAYTAADGAEQHRFIRQNASGAVVGYSFLLSFLSIDSSNAWYYEPETMTTIQPTLGIAGAVRTSDGFSRSTAVYLDNDGFMTGRYTYFANGQGPGEERLFLFHPAHGFTDLGALVEGGLTQAGWSALTDFAFPSTTDCMAGHGLVANQSTVDGSQSAFVVQRLPGGLHCAADLDDGSGGGVPDQGVDINDLLYFLLAFEQGIAAVDLDDDGDPLFGEPDGGVDINDLLFFLARFEAGC